MNITASDVKSLREKTQAGVMECKKALVEAEGDFATAEQFLKERGLLQSKKRENRETREGRVFIKLEPSKAVIVELGCETDFVAENKYFIALGNACLDLVFDGNAGALEDRVTDTVSITKENIVVKKYATMSAAENEIVYGYLHGPGRIGVLVKIWISDGSKKDDAAFRELANDLSLQIAAFTPRFVSQDGVPAEYLEKIEREYRRETEESGKPEKLWERITAGKIQKHLDRVCLSEQPYVRDETVKVSAFMKNTASLINADVKVVDFIRYEISGNESPAPHDL